MERIWPFNLIASRFSTSVRHYVKNFEAPIRDEHVLLQLHDFVVNQDGVLEPTYPEYNKGQPMLAFPRMTMLSEKAQYLVVETQLLYVQNDTKESISFELTQLFPDAEPICFLIPPVADRVPEDNRVIYQPNIVNLGFDVFSFAGMEQAILTPPFSTTLEQPDGADVVEEILQEGHPLATLILENKATLQVESIKERVMDGKTFYVIPKACLDKVRQLFEQYVFPHFQYAHFQQALLTPKTNTLSPGKRVVFMTKTIYLSIRKSTIFKTKTNEIDL